MLTPIVRSRDSFAEQIVPPGHYFMMGDNRDNSADSRYIGMVDRDRILGKATTVVLSFNYDNHHLPRWQRFFVGL
jgi:signal peptidase I